MTPALCINHKGLGGPFKPSFFFWLERVVADPTGKEVKGGFVDRFAEADGGAYPG
jgi:hypothetical protein